jgi:hypothetical protein
MAHVHTDMEHVDIHVALELCEIVIESATLVSIVFALSGLPIYVAQFPLALLNGEESLGTSEARLTKLAAFKIAAIERSGKASDCASSHQERVL